jgi:hypothetical protein
MNNSTLNETVGLTQESGVIPAQSTPTGAEPPATQPVREIGGRKDGPEPTRYGDWEKSGRCIDF